MVRYSLAEIQCFVSHELIDTVYKAACTGMELRHLRYFVTLAESLHFGKAAAKLQIAQPSLSHQIQQLEAELQTTLLQRTRRRVELTEAGRMFFEEARDILARSDRAAMVARRAGRGDAVKLRVGVGYCMDHVNATKAVGLFDRAHDHVHVELHTMAVAPQIEALKEGRLDIGFVRPPVNDAALIGEVLVREPFVAALPAKHRLAKKKSVALSALGQDPFVLPPRQAVPVYHDLVLRACREAGFIPNAPHEADHVLLMLGMVAAGTSIALVPASARQVEQTGVTYATLRPSHALLETVVTWRRNETSVFVEQFLEIARQLIARS
jgi:DNA-binding transcriptional LysR family regulator